MVYYVLSLTTKFLKNNISCVSIKIGDDFNNLRHILNSRKRAWISLKSSFGEDTAVARFHLRAASDPEWLESTADFTCMIFDAGINTGVTAASSS